MKLIHAFLKNILMIKNKISLVGFW